MGLWKGIANGIGAKKRGINWSSYWKTQSLFFLDGTIITVGENKYFEDKSAADRHFLITGYDFATDWTTGFPYKSAATISAPAGDAALIAADVNNFLYDAGGTPNQIPVVSLFEDVDYEHKIFCKHAAQVVYDVAVETATPGVYEDVEIETYEPRVSHIFMANDVLAGADLAKAYTDFGVPDEVTTDVMWATKTGNDTTGDGTKGNPFLTINKAIAAASEGFVIYAKTGIYVENDANNEGLRASNSKKVIGLGRVEINPIAPITRIGILRTGASFEGLFFNGAVTYGVTGTGKVNFCMVNNITSYAVFPTGDGIELTNSILCNSGILSFATSVSVNGCLIIVSINNKYVFFKGAEVDTTNNLEFHHNKVKVTAATPIRYSLLCNKSGVQRVTDNYVDISSSMVNAFISGSSVPTQDWFISHNTIYSSVSKTYPIITANGTPGTWLISNNRFLMPSLEDYNIEYVMVKVVDQINPAIRNNYFRVDSPDGLDCIAVYSTGVDCGDAIIDGNYISRPNSWGGHDIRVGTEHTSDGDNLVHGIITNNYIEGPVGLVAGTGTRHTIFVGFQVNPIIMYNRVYRCAIGLVLKHLGGVYATDVIASNIFDECPMGVLVKGINGAKIYNNTIVSGYGTICTGIATENTDTETVNLIIKNNIIILYGAAVARFICMANGTEVGLISDNNIIYPVVNAQMYYQGVGLTFAQWLALEFDVNSLLLNESQYNAVFKNMEDEDYSLPDGSPAIGAGEVLGAVYDDGLDASTDWGDDNKVPTIVTKQQGAAWDCGAYVS